MEVKTILKNNKHLLKVAGLDPSMSNWGIAIGELDLIEGYLTINEIHVIHPSKHKNTKLTQNVKDVLLAQDLYKDNMHILSDVDIIFAELPVGSQSARAMASYGICLGIVGALNVSLGIEAIKVTPMDVKKVVGNNNPSKLDIIEWVMTNQPEVDFPTYKQKGVTYISAAKAEHMADAVVAIYAGCKQKPFLNLLTQLRETL